MKQTKIVQTRFQEYGYSSNDWPPEDAAGFMEWFQKQFDAVPPEHRASLRIRIDAYEDAYAYIKVSYTRSETDEEEALRERQEAARARRLVEDEQRTLAALKAKYENPTTP
jgi:hypothetical protein